jgi:hypothetical protein
LTAFCSVAQRFNVGLDEIEKKIAQEFPPLANMADPEESDSSESD